MIRLALLAPCAGQKTIVSLFSDSENCTQALAACLRCSHNAPMLSVLRHKCCIVAVKLAQGCKASDSVHFMDCGCQITKGSRAAHAAGRMHFVKFETSAIDQAIEFILAKGLHQSQARSHSGRVNRVRVKATGGGAYKFAEALQVSLHARMKFCRCVAGWLSGLGWVTDCSLQAREVCVEPEGKLGRSPGSAHVFACLWVLAFRAFTVSSALTSCAQAHVLVMAHSLHMPSGALVFSTVLIIEA